MICVVEVSPCNSIFHQIKQRVCPRHNGLDICSDAMKDTDEMLLVLLYQSVLQLLKQNNFIIWKVNSLCIWDN